MGPPHAGRAVGWGGLIGREDAVSSPAFREANKRLLPFLLVESRCCPARSATPLACLWFSRHATGLGGCLRDCDSHSEMRLPRHRLLAQFMGIGLLAPGPCPPLAWESPVGRDGKVGALPAGRRGAPGCVGVDVFPRTAMPRGTLPGLERLCSILLGGEGV